MSRIEEALKRARGGNADILPNERTVPFESPWHIAPTVPVLESVGERVSASSDQVPGTLLSADVPFTGHRFARASRERLAGTDGNPVLIEQFRQLAATLHHAQAANGIRLVMVTSATPDDGKTLTAVNLAMVLSESYRRRVLLVDADLRRPSIGAVVDLTDAAGLSEALLARSDQKLGLVPITPLMTVLPAGAPVPDPIGGLTSPRMRRILDEAVARFNWVILDAPPVGPLADANLLAEMVDGTLFVIRAGRTQHADVQKSIEALGRERILGIVLNAVQEMPKQAYERYYTSDGIVAGWKG